MQCYTINIEMRGVIIMIWVITINSNICRIYSCKNRHQLTLINEINHPENRLRDIELTSDKPGRYSAGISKRGGAYSQETDPKEIKINEFIRQIAKELDLARKRNDYTHLILISDDHTGGLLFQYINKNVKAMVKNNIHKDLLHLSKRELEDFLKIHAQYPG